MFYNKQVFYSPYIIGQISCIYLKFVICTDVVIFQVKVFEVKNNLPTPSSLYLPYTSSIIRVQACRSKARAADPLLMKHIGNGPATICK